MNPANKKITLNLNEHDASKLLALIRREINQEDRIWQPYWERLAQNVETSIERASFGLFKRGNHSQDTFDKPR